MQMPRPIELLAPAKTASIGMEAIRHGADAVYIGSPRFSARAAASNSIEEIIELTNFAHLYGAKVYVAFNTILTNEQLPEAEKLIWELYRAEVDALIVQDMGLTKLNLPPISLHASTQVDNRTPQKVDFLDQCGFSQIVLARELSLEEIASIHNAVPKTRLEVFVHGALCVSYSGQCYISQALFGRSANRGECAQFCRLPLDLRDANHNLIVEGKHLLSLKDLNQSNQLLPLLQAGVSSLKIEGRLKEAPYVKNVTAYYREELDALFAQYPDQFCRASAGHCSTNFTPQPEKSFNRGFTSYFLNERIPHISQPNTPKSMGEPMGMVKDIRRYELIASGIKPWNNGDGAFFIDANGTPGGFRVNRVEGTHLFPAQMSEIANLRPKTVLYRNFDQAFDRLLNKPSLERKINVRIALRECSFGFVLALESEEGISVSLSFPQEKQEARSPQRDQLIKQLSKLGGTIFEIAPNTPELPAIEIECSREWFIPSSVLAEWRRQGVEALLRALRLNHAPKLQKWTQTTHPFPLQEGKDKLTYLGNVSNTKAEQFYHQHGVQIIEPAFELNAPANAPLMFCRHCLRYSLGGCIKHGGEHLPYMEPYYLYQGNNCFRLEFDCKTCQMKVIKEETEP